MTDYLKNFNKQIQERSNEELKEMLRHSDEYAPEALGIIKQEVLRRGEVESYVFSLSNDELSELVASQKKDDFPSLIKEAKNEAVKRGGIETLRNPVSEGKKAVYGKFRKIKVKPIKRNGQYRGMGMLQATEEGLLISGRHVYSMGLRWAIGLGIFFAFLIITITATGGAAYFAPGFIPLYLLLEYGILKREELLVPYSNINLYVAIPHQKLIGIDFKGSSYCTPVAMKTYQWKVIFDFLQAKIPSVNSSLAKISPWSKTKAAWVIPWVFLGWYLLFFTICSLLLGLILFPLVGIESITDIKNIIIRILVFILFFLVPSIPYFFLDKTVLPKETSSFKFLKDKIISNLRPGFDIW